MLVLIPETIDGKPLNLDTLGELVKRPKEGNPTMFEHIWNEILNAIGQQVTTRSHWVLMTKDVIEESRNMSYKEQQTLITEVSKRAGINDYEVPNALDAATCIFMHYLSSQERLFNDKPTTYTHCQENIKGFQIDVGGFSPAGLDVRTLRFDSDYVGVAPLRKFF